MVKQSNISHKPKDMTVITCTKWCYFTEILLYSVPRITSVCWNVETKGKVFWK